MADPAPDPIEDLLAEALARYDQGGDEAVSAFVQEHPAQRTALQRGIDRCRSLGMLGTTATRDFPERLGEFKLVRRLGSGGMGVVYEAEQTSLNRRVALKVVRPEMLFFEGARERFRREIEAVARLSHPAVVPVLASGEQEGVPFYAMELLTGKTMQEITHALADRDPARLEGAALHELLAPASGDATDPFRGAWWETSVRLIHQVALGLRHAHLRGIVHRDLKPSNVMVTPHGQAVLLDFGVATIAGAREFTRTGQTPGSPAFMSPEQLRGEAVDERTDVYSLAATLWQILALQPPFRGVDDLQKIRDGDVPDLRRRNRDVPPELALVLRTAMDRDRERRYADMESFAADLQAVLERKPIQARRLSVGLRLLRWCQRHRVAATAAAALLIGALVLPIAFAVHMNTVNAELEAVNVQLGAAKTQVDDSLRRTHDANVQLAAAKAQADDNLQVTLDALDKVLLRLGSKQLRHVPQAEQVAIEALQDAVTLYRGLLPDYPDNVRLRQNAGRSLDSLAAAQERIGRTAAAVDSYREGIDMLREPRMDLPTGWIDGRAHLHMNFASTLANHRRKAEALAEIAAAERDFAALDGLPAFRVTNLRARGVLQEQRAVLGNGSAEPEEVERALRAAADLCRQQLLLEPDDEETRATLARRLRSLANFASDKQPEGAAKLLDEALALARGLPDHARIWPPPRILVAEVLNTLGNLQLDRHDDRAMTTLEECLRMHEACAAAFPANVQIRCELAGALHNVARGHVRQNHDELALPMLLRARELELGVLRELPDFALAKDYLRTSLDQLGRVYVFLGRRQELVATLEELGALDQSTRTLRTSARLWLRALELAEKDTAPDLEQLRAQYPRKALDLLLAAEQQGWGSGNRFDEPLYAPLLAFPEFAALKARIAGK